MTCNGVVVFRWLGGSSGLGDMWMLTWVSNTIELCCACRIKDILFVWGLKIAKHCIVRTHLQPGINARGCLQRSNVQSLMVGPRWKLWMLSTRSTRYAKCVLANVGEMDHPR